MGDLIKSPGEICWMSVGEMTAMGEVHRENFVARLNGCEIDRHIRLRAAVRLHVHMLRAEQSLSAIDGQLLCHIHILASAIPALSRVTFGILVCKDTTLRFH